jgi:hypothetical protein
MHWLKIIIVIVVLVIVISGTLLVRSFLDPAERNKQLVKEAISAVLETDGSQQDYSKYVASNLTAHVDGKTFGYQQWVAHVQTVKAATKSMRVSYKAIAAERDIVSVNYVIHLVKPDGSELDLQVLEMFWLHNGKIVYVDMFSRVVSGNAADAGLISAS